MSTTTSQRPHQGQDQETAGPTRTGTIPIAQEDEERTPSEGENPQRSRLGLVLLWSAVLTCPCHFPIIVLLLLGGTVLGVYFHAHLVLLFAFSAAYFALALLIGMWLLRRSHTRGCATCAYRADGEADRDRSEQGEAFDHVRAGPWGRGAVVTTIQVGGTYGTV